MSDYFLLAWARTLGVEKGYTNNPRDLGGETAAGGLTEAVARKYGWSGSMRDLPLERVREIAKAEYWDRLRLDEVAHISLPIALELFESNYNLPWGVAAKMLQTALNALNRSGTDFPDVIVDGDVGGATISALESFWRRRAAAGETVMLRALNAQQCVHYLQGREDFVFGWILKRVAMDASDQPRV